MKICWNNIDDWKVTKQGNFLHKIKKRNFVLKKCLNCGDLCFSYKFYIKQGKGNYCSSSCASKHNPSFTGKTHSNSVKKKMSESAKKRKGIKSATWKGGITTSKLSLYDTYAHQLNWCEEVRRSPDNNDILQVKCIYCDCWFNPTYIQCYARIQSSKGNMIGEHRFYCSDGCKESCDIFGQQKYPKGFKTYKTSREVQPALRKLVLERDNWTCQICSLTDTALHCHHYEGIEQNPIESADVDNCITLCKSCHKEAHKQDGCTYHELRKC